ncbi:hypothetical protein MKD33_02035, partial [Chromobacterium piscinae]
TCSADRVRPLTDK